jgi:two-component system response regulator
MTNVFDIMIIEDNENDIEMIMEALRERDMRGRIVVLKDGAAAIDYFFGPQKSFGAEAGHLPRMILLDLKLPKVSGQEILKRLKSDENTRHIPTVVFSSSNEERDRNECYLYGANSYVVKPLDADVFAQFVSNIGTYWISMNRPAYNNS